MSSILLTHLRKLVKSHLSYILTYVLSAKDRHMMVKMYFLLTYLHICRPIKFMLFHTSHLFLIPPRLTKSGHPFTFIIVNDVTQQTRCRRCPSNQMPTYDRWLLAKKHPFSYMLTYVLCMNDRYNCKKTRCKGHHGHKTAEITLLCNKVLCFFCTLLASPVYKKVTAPCNIAKWSLLFYDHDDLYTVL